MKLLLACIFLTLAACYGAATIDQRIERAQFRGALQRQQVPPSLQDPPPTIPAENSCQSDCVEERLADCEQCFPDNPERAATCSRYINLVAAGEEGISSPEWKKTWSALRKDAVSSISATCIGFISYVLRPPYSLYVPTDDYLLFWATGLILEMELNKDSNQKVRVTHEDVKDKKVGRAGSKSPVVSIPYRVEITIRSESEIRQEVIRKAMEKLSKDYQFSSNVNKNVIVVKRQNRRVYLVIFEFTKKYLDQL